MRTLRVAGLASLAAGGLLLAYAAMQGDVRVGLFLIVPFVYGTGLAPFLGMLLAMAGIVMLFLSAFSASPLGPVPGAPDVGGGEATREARVERRSGGVVLLGPIPIVWGDARRRPWMIGVGAAMLLLWLFFILR